MLRSLVLNMDIDNTKTESKAVALITLLPIILFFGALLFLFIGALMSANEKKANTVEKKRPESFVGYKLDDVCDYYAKVEECIRNGYCDEDEYKYTVMPSIRFDDGIVYSKISCQTYETSIRPHEVLYVSEFFYEKEDIYDRYGNKDGYTSSKYFRASPLDETERRGVTIRD